MDEVVQMMGGLAYMTGPPGQPLRAGTSVIDIGGGMFGVMGILAALYDQAKTKLKHMKQDESDSNESQLGLGQTVKSSLFETTAFFMGQHMAYSALTEGLIPPMPARVSAWSIYRVFTTQDHPIFIGIISDKQWVKFCQAFGRDDWINDPRLTTNSQRIDERDWLVGDVEAMLAEYTQTEIISKVEPLSIPFAPISRPEDLFEDLHLNQSNGLTEVELKPGYSAKVPKLPLEMNGHRLGQSHPAPKIGEGSRALLEEIGYDVSVLDGLQKRSIITGLD